MKRIAPFLILFFSTSLWGADFHFYTTALGQVRDNAKTQTEIPINGYVGGGFAQEPWHLSMQTDMRFSNDTDLYQAVFHYQPLDTLQLDSGRQFISEGFSVETIDGIRLSLQPWQHLHIALYSGMPRSVERGDFRVNDGLLTGITVGIKNIPRTNITFHSAWRKNDFTQMSWNHNDELRVGANLSHQFAVTTTPMVTGLFEYDVTGKLIDTGTVGLDIYPTRRIALNLEGSYTNANHSLNRKTIQSIFTEDRTLSGKISTTITLVPHWLDLIGSYAYRTLEVQKGDRKLGYLADASLKFSWEELGLTVLPGYYYAKSFGGDLNGTRGMIREDFTEKFYTTAGIDYTKYQKITHDNDTAFSASVWNGVEMLKGWTISGGVEYNHNNFFNKDWRGTFRINYSFDKGAS